jgi:hypothetical protein
VTLIATPPEVLFQRHITATDTGCWIWIGPRNGTHPQLGWSENRQKRRQPARAWAWERLHGPVPAGALVVATCDHTDCVNPVHATVRTHAEHRAADPEAAAVRFWKRVDRSGGPDACWPWLGFVDPRSGYPRTTWMGNNIGAHQLAFQLANGWRPTGRDRYVCHHCDNPVCCNPAHLYAGTPAQNSADRDRRGRAIVHRGTTNTGAKLTAEQVREIRRRHAAGGTSYPKLAAEFGLHPQNIGRIVRGEGYADVA